MSSLKARATIAAMLRHARACLVLVLLLLTAGHGVAQTPAGGQAPPAPAAARPQRAIRLVLLVAIDQFRHDYLWRFRHEYTGGLKTLLTRGAVFSSAYLEHYPTVTAVGHSTMLSGATPSVSGIIGNDWFDRPSGKVVQSITDETVTLVGAEGAGASPRRLLVSTVADELKAAAALAGAPEVTPRVIGISYKDRAAILPAGRGADAAYWQMASNGPFVSSTYYQPDLPEWVVAFNKKPLQVNARGTVDLNGRVAAFAVDGLTAEKLGQRQATDLLTVSLSENDTVGHAFGPDSPQVREVALGADRALATLFDAVDRNVGLANTLIVLTADHAVAPVPEVQEQRRMPGGRVNGQELFAPIRAALQARFGPGEWLSATAGSSPYLNYQLVTERGLDPADVRRVAAEAAMQAPHVARVYTRDQLLRGEVAPDLVGRRVLRGFHPQRSGDLEIVLEPFWMRQQTGTTHGTPYNYDAHVPLVFMGPGVAPGTYPQRVALNDLAPTVSAMLEIEVPSAADGRVLTEMLARPAAR